MSVNKIMIIDNGTGFCKVGFSGEDEPSLKFPAFVGQKKKMRSLLGSNTDVQFFVGPEAEKEIDFLDVSYPMRHGLVENWQNMPHIWQFAISQLRVNPETTSLIISVAPTDTNDMKLKMAEILFEDLKFKALYIGIQAELAMYTSLEHTGTVLDIADLAFLMLYQCTEETLSPKAFNGTNWQVKI